MTATCIIAADTAGLPFTTEDLPASGIGYLDRAAAFAIWNPSGSDRVIRLKSIAIREMVARSGTALSDLILQRTTAMSGGLAVAPVQMDTSATALPSQVLVQIRPGAITTAGATLRRRPERYALAATGGLTQPSRGGRAAPWGPGLDAAMMHTATFTDVQGLVLREGEGLALTTSSTMGQAGCYEVRVYLQVGTDTHLFVAPVYPTMNPAIWGVLNGSGSGVVVTVVRIEMAEIRVAPTLAAWEMHTIGGCYGGSDIDPIWLDTGASSTLGTARAVTGPGVVLANADAVTLARARVGGDKPLRRVVLPPFGVGPGLASGAVGAFARAFGDGEMLYHARSSDPDLVLREGEGLAVVQRVDGNASGGAYRIEAWATVEDTSTPGGGGGAFAFAFAG